MLWNVLLAFSPCSINIYERSEGNIDQFVVSFAVRQSQFNRLCNPERGWAFERVLDGGLDGYDHKTIPGTETRADCARLCLLEEDFDCRSAEYAAEKKRCVLSREDRRTQPEAFGTAPGVDYIENQCAKREFDKQSQTSSESLSETTPQVWAKKNIGVPMSGTMRCLGTKELALLLSRALYENENISEGMGRKNQIANLLK